MSWRYVEPCCGSASIALALLGARKALLPYQGSKWRFRERLIEEIVALGFEGTPRRMDLIDAGPWGVVAPCVITPASRAGVVDQLRLMDRLDARQVYEALHKQPAPEDPVCYSAQFLFLQRLAFSGKAVGDGDGVWSSPGFNTSSAYGLPATDKFGKVNPMIPSLIRVLGTYQDIVCPERLHGLRAPARAPSEPVTEPTLVYLDPPYANSTGYPGGTLGRDGVVKLAVGWAQAGASVIVSEGETIGELAELGWTTRRIDKGRKDTSRFRGKQEEWITVWDQSRRA